MTVGTSGWESPVTRTLLLLIAPQTQNIHCQQRWQSLSLGTAGDEDLDAVGLPNYVLGQYNS